MAAGPGDDQGGARGKGKANRGVCRIRSLPTCLLSSCTSILLLPPWQRRSLACLHAFTLGPSVIAFGTSAVTPSPVIFPSKPEEAWRRFASLIAPLPIIKSCRLRPTLCPCPVRSAPNLVDETLADDQSPSFVVIRPPVE